MGTAKFSLDLKMTFFRNVEPSKSFFKNGSAANDRGEANSADSTGNTTSTVASDDVHSGSW